MLNGFLTENDSVHTFHCGFFTLDIHIDEIVKNEGLETLKEAQKIKSVVSGLSDMIVDLVNRKDFFIPLANSIGDFVKAAEQIAEPDPKGRGACA
jgi:hypothetical protein